MGEPIRLLILTYEYPPLGGGTGVAVRQLAHALPLDDAIDVDVVTASPDASSVEEERPGLRVHRLNIGKRGMRALFQSQTDLGRYAAQGWRYAARLVRRQGIDLVHAFQGVPCGFQASLLGRPYLVSLRGADVPGYDARFAWMERVLLRPLDRGWIWRRAAHVSANSEWLAALARRTAPDLPIEIIRNGVDTETFFPADSVRDGEDCRALFVGRLNPVKGVRILLEAFAAAVEEVPGLRLDLAGDGPLRPWVESFCTAHGLTDRVSVLGRVSHENLPDLYRRADLFVLPSLSEANSNAALEAMASGLPLIVTEGGSAELVADNGVVVPVGAVEPLRDALRTLARDRGARQRMGAASRRRASSQSWQQAADRYLDIYRVILAGQKPCRV